MRALPITDFIQKVSLIFGFFLPADSLLLSLNWPEDRRCLVPTDFYVSGVHFSSFVVFTHSARGLHGQIFLFLRMRSSHGASPVWFKLKQFP